MIKGMEEVGIDHQKLLSTYIKAYQECLRGRPEDMNVGLHLCRGNFRVNISSFERAVVLLVARTNTAALQ